MKNYEIIIDENATKLESIDSGFGPPSQGVTKRSCIFWQLEPNQSKLLLAYDLVNEKSNKLYDLILFNKKTTDKDLLLAQKLLKKVKIPDWNIKKQILEKQKKELEIKLKKDIHNIKEKIEIWTGYKLKPIKVFLVYAPVPYSNTGAGGHSLNTIIPTITLRISSTSKISTALITHELLHIILNNTKERIKIEKINENVEETIFDLLSMKLYKYLKTKNDWNNEIKIKIRYRGQEYKKYIYEIYDMLKPILHGKDDLIWKYIDWKKLEKIKANKND